MNIRFRLTKGQRLRIIRLRNEETQVQAAERMGVTRKRYKNWEDDVYNKLCPTLSVGKLTPNERCLLLRREAGMRQDEFAKVLGLSRGYVNQMELGRLPCRRLMEYWNGHEATTG